MPVTFVCAITWIIAVRKKLAAMSENLNAAIMLIEQPDRKKVARWQHKERFLNHSGVNTNSNRALAKKIVRLQDQRRISGRLVH